MKHFDSLLTITIAAALYLCTSNLNATADIDIARAKAVAESYFGNRADTLTIAPLSGGYSSASKFHISDGENEYALRLQDPSETRVKADLELYMMSQAAAVGVAPEIYYITPDKDAVLMQFLKGGTVNVEDAKTDMAAIADAMQRVHAIPATDLSVQTFLLAMKGIYSKFSPHANDKGDVDEALAIIERGYARLEELNPPKVNIHGDLNPRNIFALDGKIYFIDWSDSTWDDPFLDLTYFTTLCDYSNSDEEKLLHCYLKRTPTEAERERYLLSKQLNFARLCIGAYYVYSDLSPGDAEQSATGVLRRSWSQCAKLFASSGDALTPAFFYDAARAALWEANALAQ